ncbi:hypothetical protein B4U80_13230 [Leptotrombidium deliense]|uniref:DNA-directed RNA polymerase n=1 Tax=Leptotrombidium deliense TaxID=299467 RepID=A0A443SA33_9ACAR|nr:hypothetical protein B4U80_13230 [Leptotrombidium deliense]
MVSVSIGIDDKLFDLDVPIIIGTRLWFGVSTNFQQTAELSKINYDVYREMIEQTSKSPITIACPSCDFAKYEAIGCFILNGKLMHLPIFAYVDPQKLHVNRSNAELTAYFNRQKLNIPVICEKIKTEVDSWRDNFSNYSFLTSSNLFWKYIRIFYEFASKVNWSIECYSNEKLKTNVASNRNKNIRDCVKEDIAYRKKVILKARNIKHNIENGHVTEPVSKRTVYKTTEMGGQMHELADNNNNLLNATSTTASVRKSDTQTRTGFYRQNSRFITTALNNPLLLMKAALHVVKLVSGNVLTNYHQSFHTSGFGYVCANSTVDNKNAGMYLEIIPGVIFSSRSTTKVTYETILSEMLDVNANNYEPETKRRKIKTSIDNTIKKHNEGIIVDHAMKEYRIKYSAEHIGKAVFNICNNFSKGKCLPLEFFLSHEKGVGIIRLSTSAPNTLLDAKYRLTPATREWLMREQFFNYLLPPKRNNIVPLIGLTASSGFLVNHSSTNKTTSGLCGYRHACGLPLFCKTAESINQIRHPHKGLLYPQNNLAEEFGSAVLVPSQLAFVVVCSDNADGVEDGIIISKGAVERGFGSTKHTFVATLIVKPCKRLVYISIISSTEQQNNRGNGNFRKQFCYDCSTENFSLNDSEIYKDTTSYLISASRKEITILLNKYHLEEGMPIFDVHGVSRVRSFSINLRTHSVQSATRVCFHDAYDCGTFTNTNKRSIFAEKIHLTFSCGDIVVTTFFNELKQLFLGDKYSTLDGQKSTVVAIKSQEDMPFVMDANIPNIDICVNISANKRHTIGMFLASNIRALKCATPDDVKLKELQGDKSIAHHHVVHYCVDENNELDYISDLISKAQMLRELPLYNGKNGISLNFADLFCVNFVRYDQEGSKCAYYAGDRFDVVRIPHGNTLAKGRGKHGAMKFGQTETIMQLLLGASNEYPRLQMCTSESHFSHDNNTGKISQSAAQVLKALLIHNVNYNVICNENDY